MLRPPGDRDCMKVWPRSYLLISSFSVHHDGAQISRVLMECLVSRIEAFSTTRPVAMVELRIRWEWLGTSTRTPNDETLNSWPLELASRLFLKEKFTNLVTCTKEIARWLFLDLTLAMSAVDHEVNRKVEEGLGKVPSLKLRNLSTISSGSGNQTVSMYES